MKTTMAAVTTPNHKKPSYNTKYKIKLALKLVFYILIYKFKLGNSSQRQKPNL